MSGLKWFFGSKFIKYTREGVMSRPEGFYIVTSSLAAVPAGVVFLLINYFFDPDYRNPDILHDNKWQDTFAQYGRLFYENPVQQFCTSGVFDENINLALPTVHLQRMMFGYQGSWVPERTHPKEGGLAGIKEWSEEDEIKEQKEQAESQKKEAESQLKESKSREDALEQSKE